MQTSVLVYCINQIGLSGATDHTWIAHPKMSGYERSFKVSGMHIHARVHGKIWII